MKLLLYIKFEVLIITNRWRLGFKVGRSLRETPLERAFGYTEYLQGRPMLCREWWLSQRFTYRH